MDAFERGEIRDAERERDGTRESQKRKEKKLSRAFFFFFYTSVFFCLSQHRRHLPGQGVQRQADHVEVAPLDPLHERAGGALGDLFFLVVVEEEEVEE